MVKDERDVTQPHDEGNEAPILLAHAPDGVSTITFNRPRQRNAMNRAARAGFIQALDECRGRSKVIILTGNGPAFCAGVDLKEGPLSDGEVALPGSPEALFARRATWDGVQEELRHHPAIVIAAVNGYALGGGSTLVNVADLAVASRDAQIGMPEIGFGLYPTLAGPAVQLNLTKKRAAWMVLTAERISGGQAAEWGLVNEAVEADDLLSRAKEIASRIAAFDATGLEWSKRALWKIPDEISDWTGAVEYGTHVAAQIRGTSNAVAEGLQGFSRGERAAGQGG